jgi:hypothetical protein
VNFDGVDELIEHGFQGFKTVAELQACACRDVPREQGVYVVLRLQRGVPEFLPENPGGRFKGQDPTVSIDRLRSTWVEGPIVIYIGKAGSRGGNATLRSRLFAYMEFGRGRPVGHWGGRYIWQLACSSDFVVSWRPTPGQAPVMVERGLIQQFKGIYGMYPFANLRA